MFDSEAVLVSAREIEVVVVGEEARIGRIGIDRRRFGEEQGILDGRISHGAAAGKGIEGGAERGDGNYNVGRYSNQRMDYLVDRIKAETDAPVRARMLTEALQLSNDTVSHIPLHDQVIPWAMKKNVELVHRADNRVDMRLVKVN